MGLSVSEGMTLYSNIIELMLTVSKQATFMVIPTHDDILHELINSMTNRLAVNEHFSKLPIIRIDQGYQIKFFGESFPPELIEVYSMEELRQFVNVRDPYSDAYSCLFDDRIIEQYKGMTYYSVEHIANVIKMWCQCIPITPNIIDMFVRMALAFHREILMTDKFDSKGVIANSIITDRHWDELNLKHVIAGLRAVEQELLDMVVKIPNTKR